MSWVEELFSRAAQASSKSAEERCNALAEDAPQPLTLLDLVSVVREVAVKPTNTQVFMLLVLACLKKVVYQDPKDEDAVRALASIIGQTIRPLLWDLRRSMLPSSDGEEDGEKMTIVVQRCAEAAEPATQALEHLAQLTSPATWIHDDEFWPTLIALADTTQDWTKISPKVPGRVNALLQARFAGDHAKKEQFIAEEILQRYLRPLFSKSKPASITAAGRKAEYQDPSAGRGEGLPDDSEETKPWKFKDARAIPAVAWAVDQADEQLISKHWPLLIPVLLTLTDDNTTAVRCRGLKILIKFLAKFPSKTLRNAGLSQVFEDAIFPTLSYLPTLTPEDESVQLLDPAFEVLLCLADMLETTTASGATNHKMKLLDKMLREGVFSAYFHAKVHVHIVELLYRQLALILNQMGIYAVKHLKDLIPMISATLTDPFALAAPATLLSAIKALQAVLAACWPRIHESPWQDEIINALTLCWCNTHDDDSIVFIPIRPTFEQELILSAKALAAVLKTEGVDLAVTVTPLVAKEPSLGRLFVSAD
ncbi:hypothetical protein B0T25DRAFT_214675 [Lasiosphaeria hispida]|uniref:Uncharacterized protein n=1 Tax=Lasiosphaeria hispida TaxID=260671 RepID=A0AAJ0HJJ9_9PEZI|nr:hypothetical protein B0T25DRAFT_214675 [Lasiosphaeria hispida]